MAEKDKVFLHNINFLPIPEKLKSLLVFIAFRCQKGVFKQSDSKIAAIFGNTDRSVRTWVQELKKDGWIIINNPGDPKNRTIQITIKTQNALEMNTQDLINKTEENFRIESTEYGRKLPINTLDNDGKNLPSNTEENFPVRRNKTSKSTEENILQKKEENKQFGREIEKVIGFTSFLDFLRSSSFKLSLLDLGYNGDEVNRSIDRFINENQKKDNELKTQEHWERAFIEFHGKKSRKKRDQDRDGYLELIEKSLNFFDLGESVAKNFGITKDEWPITYQHFVDYCLRNIPVIENENHPIILLRTFLEQKAKYSHA